MMITSQQQVALPADLASPQAKLVYLALFAGEEATASELQQLLGLPKLTLLPILTSLVAKDFVQRTEGGYASR